METARGSGDLGQYMCDASSGGRGFHEEVQEGHEKGNGA